MIGAHKIDDTTDDLERLQEFFDRGLNNCQIQREYRTNAGEQISRVHISHIRRGTRWNQGLRSFLMKNELDNPDLVKSQVGNLTFRTELGTVVSASGIFYIYLRYEGLSQIKWDSDTILIKKPTTGQILQSHNQFVYERVSSLC
jgi:hypothetical protein